MSIPLWRSAGAVASGTTGIAPALPAGTVAGDTLLLFVETADQAVATPAGGWAPTPDSPRAVTGITRLSSFWLRASGNDAAPSIADPGDHVIGIVHRFSGCATVPWHVTAGGTEAVSDTSLSVPAITTTIPEVLVVVAVCTDTDIGTTRWGVFTNATMVDTMKRSDSSTASGNGGGIAVATGMMPIAGSTGATTATALTATNKAFITLSLKAPDPDFTCPLDGRPLPRLAPVFAGDVGTQAVVGEHMHYGLNSVVSCGGGHDWRVSGDLIMERQP